jgi:hypothetical protein
MRILRLRNLLASLLCAGLLLVIGCGGSAGLTQPTSTGKVSVKVAWPTSSRYLPDTINSLTITVTGPGITTPITGTLTKPDTSLTLIVPAGTNRYVVAEGYDDTEKYLLGGKAMTQVLNGVTSYVAIVLNSVYEPENNLQASAPLLQPLMPGASKGIYDLIDSRTDTHDTEDYYRVMLNPGMPFFYGLQGLDMPNTQDVLHLEIFDPTSTLVFEGDTVEATKSIVGSFTPQASGYYVVKISYAGEATDFIARYYLNLAVGTPDGEGSVYSDVK